MREEVGDYGPQLLDALRNLTTILKLHPVVMRELLANPGDFIHVARAEQLIKLVEAIE